MEISYWEKLIKCEHYVFFGGRSVGIVHSRTEAMELLLCIFTQHLMLHTFSTSCVHCYILCLKKQRKQPIFNINTYFMISTTYAEFQTHTIIMPQGNSTSDCKINQHIEMQR
jgi:hypothetical protein